jgi:hypothetical protein
MAGWKTQRGVDKRGESKREREREREREGESFRLRSFPHGCAHRSRTSARRVTTPDRRARASRSSDSARSNSASPVWTREGSSAGASGGPGGGWADPAHADVRRSARSSGVIGGAAVS